MISKVYESDYSEENHTFCHPLLHSAGREQESILWDLGLVLKVVVLVCRAHGRQSHPDRDTHIHRLALIGNGATVRHESFRKALTCLGGSAYYQKQFQDKANSS